MGSNAVYGSGGGRTSDGRDDRRHVSVCGRSVAGSRLSADGLGDASGNRIR